MTGLRPGVAVVVTIPQDNDEYGVQAQGVCTWAGGGEVGVKWPDGRTNVFHQSWVSVVESPWRPTEFGQRFTARRLHASATRAEFVYAGNNRAATRDSEYLWPLSDLRADFEPVSVPIPPVVDEALDAVELELVKRGFTSDGLIRSVLAEVRARLRKEAGR